MAKKKDKARTFRQDLMRGEHQLGTTTTAQAPTPNGVEDRGLLDLSLPSRHIGYYKEKTAAEARLGRTLTNEEFERDYMDLGDGRPKMNGLLMSLSSHPRYYEQKSAAEAACGHALTNEEFERDYLQMPEDSKIISGTSIFDPVVAELAYRWFCPLGGQVFDPFAGGSVRGIVASKLGRRYTGIDLSERQLAANREQAEEMHCSPMPVWIAGDARQARELCPDLAADFILSCPPYGDLERYSDDPRDLSTMTWEGFVTALRVAVASALAMLRPDRFACFVVGDIRDSDGFYLRLPDTTTAAFEACGARLYNEGILVTVPGSMPVRVGKQFEGSRKLGKTHQNVLVFCNGDPKKATAAVGAVEFDSSVFNDVIEPGAAE